MAARRALIVVLAFVGGISIVAAFMPIEPQTGSEDESSTSTSSGSTPAEERAAPRSEPEGELIRRTVRPGEEPPTIRAAVGDQLELLVYADRAGEVELPRIGPSAFADEFAPARFDVQLFDTGSFDVRQVETGDVLAKIEVGRASPAADETNAERERRRSERERRREMRPDSDPMQPRTERV